MPNFFVSFLGIKFIPLEEHLALLSPSPVVVLLLISGLMIHMSSVIFHSLSFNNAYNIVLNLKWLYLLDS